MCLVNLLVFYKKNIFSSLASGPTNSTEQKTGFPAAERDIGSRHSATFVNETFGEEHEEKTRKKNCSSPPVAARPRSRTRKASSEEHESRKTKEATARVFRAKRRTLTGEMQKLFRGEGLNGREKAEKVEKVRQFSERIAAEMREPGL